MRPKNEELWKDGLTKEQLEEAEKELHEWFRDKEEAVDTLLVYTFADGTVLRLFNVGLSVDEVWKLAELHGRCQSIATESI